MHLFQQLSSSNLKALSYPFIILSLGKDKTMKPLKRVKNRELYYLDQNGNTIKGFHGNLRGDCTELSGDCSGLNGDCTGLRGDCTELIGNCSGLSGDCSGLSGNCTELSGDLNEIKKKMRMLN